MEHKFLLKTETWAQPVSQMVLDEEALFSYYNALPIEQVRVRLNELFLETEPTKGGHSA